MRLALRFDGYRMRLRVEIALWRWGVGWMLAVAMVVVAATGVLKTLSLQRDLSAQASTQAAGVPNESRGASPVQLIMATPTSPRAEQQAAWQALNQALPAQEQVEALLADLYSLAARHSVSLQEAEFQYRADADLGWTQVSIQLPVRGAYPAVRSLVDAMLRQHPNLALDQWVLKREGVAADQAEAALRLTAWFRRDDATAQHRPQGGRR